jgi:hypothetical protein
MTALGAVLGAVFAVLVTGPSGIEFSGGVLFDSASFGIMTLLVGVSEIWPIAVWLIAMGLLQELAKKLRAASRPPAINKT